MATINDSKNAKLEKIMKKLNTEPCFIFKDGTIPASVKPIASAVLQSIFAYGDFDYEINGDFGDFCKDKNKDFSFDTSFDIDWEEYYKNLYGDEDYKWNGEQWDDDHIRDVISDHLDEFRDNFPADDVEVRNGKLFVFNNSISTGRDGCSTAYLFELEKCRSLKHFLSFDFESFLKSAEEGTYDPKYNDLKRISLTESEIIEYLMGLEE